MSNKNFAINIFNQILFNLKVDVAEGFQIELD